MSRIRSLNVLNMSISPTSATLNCCPRQRKARLNYVGESSTMRPEDIRELLRRQPFRPIRLILTNNIVHEIRHRDLVTVKRSVLQIGFPSSEEADPSAEHEIGIALIHIVQ